MPALLLQLSLAALLGTLLCVEALLQHMQRLQQRLLAQWARTVAGGRRLLPHRPARCLAACAAATPPQLPLLPMLLLALGLQQSRRRLQLRQQLLQRRLLLLLLLARHCCCRRARGL